MILVSCLQTIDRIKIDDRSSQNINESIRCFTPTCWQFRIPANSFPASFLLTIRRRARADFNTESIRIYYHDSYSFRSKIDVY